MDIVPTLLRPGDLIIVMPREMHTILGIPPEAYQCLIACHSTSMPSGHSMKKRSSSLTRVSVGRAQTPAKSDKGTTEDQGG